MKNSLTICLLFLSICCFAQGPKSEKEREKQIREGIEKEIQRYEDVLKLEDWQVFYADSVLTANYAGMQEELKSMTESKVSNADLYTMAVDKWQEKTYEAFRKFLTDEQWAKYLKTGAGRAKKDRDKRAEKRK